MLRPGFSRLFCRQQNELISQKLICLHRFVRSHIQHACCKPSWTPSASVIVTLKDSLVNQLQALLPICVHSPKKFPHDYHLLLLKRPQSSLSFGGKMVFPGGTVCRTDFECDLWTESVPLDAKFEARSRPPIYTEVMRQFRLTDTSALRLHPSVILRLCALRELFEETGLLLVENDSVPQPSANAFILCGEELRYWQDQLSHNSSSFPALYKHLLQRPPLNALSEWSNWLTPKEFVRRFDTIFYHVHLERILSRAGSIDSHVKWQSPEVDSMYVGKPAAFLHGSTDFLVPPQIYELGRLCQFVQSDQLTRFAQQRAILGCRRWCPIPIHVAIAGQRCTIYLVPGDERYEQVMRSEHTKLTAVDLVSDCHRNRLVISSGASQLWWDSSVYELGHVTPVTCAEYRIFYG